MCLCWDAIKSSRSICQISGILEFIYMYIYIYILRDEKCYLIMLFAVLSAEDALLLPDAARILS